MDFKSLLQSFDTLSEAETKDTKTGRVHKGDYGNSYDAGEDHEVKSADAPKKGRGRPKKGADDSGEVKSYDTKSIGNVFGAGSKPSKSVGTVSKKHSLKEYIESVESSKQLDEAVIAPTQPTNGMGGKQTNSGNPQQDAQKNAAISNNARTAISKLSNAGISIPNKSQAANTAMKAAIQPNAQPTPQDKDAEMNLAAQVNNLLSKAPESQVDQFTNVIKQMTKSATPSGLAEEGGEKWIQKAIKHPGALTKKAHAAGMTPSAFAKKHEHDSGTTGKQARLAQTLSKMHHEDMAEGAKPDFLDMDKDGNKKETMKKAVKDKAEGNVSSKRFETDSQRVARIAKEKRQAAKDKVSESRIHEDSDYTYETVAKVLAREKPGLNTNSDDFSSAVYHELIAIGMTPKSAHNLMSFNEDFLSDVATSYEHYQHNPSLDEGATEDFAQKAPGIKPSKVVQVPAKQEPTPWKVDPINAATDRAYNFISNLRKDKTFESDDMKDVQFESWEKQLNGLLNEGITVSTSTGQQGAPDSVSINATDADAEQLLSVLRTAGVGVFGGNEKPEIGYGVAQGGEEEPTGTGTEPEAAPEVVGDEGDMLALIKKMAGMGDEGPAQGGDYEDEESSEEPQDGTLEPASADDEDSDDEEQDSGEESDDEEEEQTDEGNAFTGKLKDTPKGGEFKMGDKEYKDTSSIEENEEMCDECGMMECECDHGDEEQVEECWANDAGGDAEGSTELMKLKALLSMGNDLHKMKRSQSVGNPTKVTMEDTLMKNSTEMLTDWKKLSGI